MPKTIEESLRDAEKEFRRFGGVTCRGSSLKLLTSREIASSLNTLFSRYFTEQANFQAQVKFVEAGPPIGDKYQYDLIISPVGYLTKPKDITTAIQKTANSIAHALKSYRT
ncbi:Uncharacterised protein [uncultured archaeon]|nr:Uncharacterised protein [uncultured archaeon]